jgi:hypothetical protein
MEVSVSNIGSESKYPEEFCSFSQSLQVNARPYLKFCHVRFIPNPFKYIIY